MKLLCIKI